ncbi:MAG: PilZ domain-containing protein [Nitrospirota bacterium]|nr:PilZ domain-containing protein [Nitrospirota bacterium]
MTNQCGLFDGHGIVWNLSLAGRRFSGDQPLRVGKVSSLTVNLPTQQRTYIAAGIVRWVRGEECGVETLVIDGESRGDMEQYFRQRVQESIESIP